MATIEVLSDRQRRDLTEALQVAVDDVNDRILPERVAYAPEDIAEIEAQLGRWVDLINQLQGA